MDFRTELSPEKLPALIRPDARVVTIGSCFADVLGRQLTDNKVAVRSNPFGTLFNPVSIAKLQLASLQSAEPDPDLYVERDGLWFHYDFHSIFWGRSQDELRGKLTDLLTQTGEALRTADWLVLTLGTATVYRHLETGKVVANCQKMPGFLFEKYLYAYEHVQQTLTDLVKKLKRANPGLQILLTVSPVRHTKDTLPLNQASKSILRAVSHELTVWNEQVHYFPAYEIMLDDLRDYRFYEADLIHPNAVAETYIFEKFAECAFDDELRSFITEWQTLRKSMAHRPFHEGTESHRRFLEKLLQQLDAVSKKADVTREKQEIESRLRAFKTIDPGANQAA
ncbi:GSCFA domain-containing protein [Larkinella humicola]|uniref:GSCFA domain-containing protein n=1 Tax=Larkinella humicola TaxID=2607654 RepID=A0A5N1J9N0_9BACT|nr:GSCFA domain-containing protein [Larkinella humicola]KAA9349161.1 GSCFA domain-containing protein [Larkinella humicola]